jgi:NDP-sugar pyrophosphorylase family protein
MKGGEQMLKQLFDLDQTEHDMLFKAYWLPWEWVAGLRVYLRSFPSRTPSDLPGDVTVDEAEGNVHIEDDVVIRPGVAIYGPTFIGRGTFVNHGALLRGGLIMNHCSIGHCVEIKNSILLPYATCGHRNYVGDSVLGRDVNMGDGSGIANLRADRDPAKTIKVTWGGERIDTGLQKFGALVGSGTSLGCRSTLNPGTILGKNCLVMPNTVVRGTYPSGTMLMWSAETIAKDRP